MSKHNVVALSGREKIRDELTELIRDGAHKLIAQGLVSGSSDGGMYDPGSQDPRGHLVGKRHTNDRNCYG